MELSIYLNRSGGKNCYGFEGRRRNMNEEPIMGGRQARLDAFVWAGE